MIAQLEEKVECLTLSNREKQVILLWINDWNYKDIAKELSLSESTIRTYISRIYIKMNAKSKLELLILTLGIS